MSHVCPGCDNDLFYDRRTLSVHMSSCKIFLGEMTTLVHESQKHRHEEDQLAKAQRWKECAAAKRACIEDVDEVEEVEDVPGTLCIDSVPFAN